MVLNGTELHTLAAIRKAPSVRLVYAARGLLLLRLEPPPDGAP